ncbi:MAG: hypothetical protein R2769_07420 [Saprospiraceae bacterium]
MYRINYSDDYGESILLPVITSSGADLCLNDTRALLGNPAGGSFSVISGPGSIGAGDILSASATGSITIEYSYTDGNGCTGTTTQVITVIGLPTPMINSSAAPMCIDDTRSLIGTPLGGTFSVTGPGSGAGDVLTATGAGSIVVTYSYTDGNGCTVDVIKPLQVMHLQCLLILVFYQQIVILQMVQLTLLVTGTSPI